MELTIFHNNTLFVASYINCTPKQNSRFASEIPFAMLWARFFFIAAQLGTALGKEQAVLTSSRHESHDLDAIREKYCQTPFIRNVPLT